MGGCTMIFSMGNAGAESKKTGNMVLDNDTPADRAGIKITGNNKWITLIQNVRQSDSMLLSIISLIAIALGTGFLGKATIVSKKDAIELGVSRIAGDTDEENLKLPAVQFFLKQSRLARIGLSIVVLGILLQVVLLVFPTIELILDTFLQIV
ncbi:MAG: hypothetical protein AABY17_01480 [Thermoproteota archaeon]